MSISQLLSSDAPPRPPQQPPTAAPVRISPLSQSQTFERENQTVPEAKPSSQIEQQQQQQQPSFRSNGIRNLLNNESEETAQPMADSDTDTEDIPLISQGAGVAIATPTTKNHDRQVIVCCVWNFGHCHKQLTKRGNCLLDGIRTTEHYERTTTTQP